MRDGHIVWHLPPVDRIHHHAPSVLVAMAGLNFLPIAPSSQESAIVPSMAAQSLSQYLNFWSLQGETKFPSSSPFSIFSLSPFSPQQPFNILLDNQSLLLISQPGHIRLLLLPTRVSVSDANESQQLVSCL
jgi:hypothetical protein